MPTTINAMPLNKCTINDDDLCKKITIHGQLVWSASVVLNNLIGLAAETEGKDMDAAWAIRYARVKRQVEANKRYYVRWRTRSYGGAYHTVKEESYLKLGEKRYFEKGGFGLRHAIITPEISGQLQITASSHCCTDAGTSSLIYCDAYMLVDITELETQMNTTFTTDTFYEFIGSKVFYGSKEFDT